MLHSTTSQKMPFRLILSGVFAAVLLIATVLVGLYLGTETQRRFQNIDQSWQAFSGEAQRRGELLSRIRGHLGYGGIIHNFKNYVLRQDQTYLDRLNLLFTDFEATVEEYNRSGASEIELKHLAKIEKTIANYADKVPVARQAALEQWEPTQTDKLVKVDDTEAILGLAALEAYWREKDINRTRDIVGAVSEGQDLVSTGFRYLGGLALVALLLFCLFYLLQNELRQTIGLLSNELNERRLAEFAAKKFRRAVDQSSATIVITDTRNRIEYVNQKFCELTGYAEHEVIGKTPKFLQSGDTPHENYVSLRHQLARGEEWHGTFRNLKKSGDYYWAKTRILPLRDDLGHIANFIGLGEDLTERRKARDQMHRAQKMEAVSLLASGVAHDFNNVLTTILGNVHLAKLDTPPDSEIFEELEHIEVAAKRARNLIGQIFAFARRQTSKPMSLRIQDVIEEVVNLVRSSTQPNIVIDCEVEDETISVKADPTKLHQVIINLCSNAVEAIGPEGGHIVVQAGRCGPDDPYRDHVRISVSDDGPGISDDLKQKIFDPFFTTKPVGKGTGLGLSVVANLVADMNGQIYVESEPGNGSTFTMHLPEAASAQDVPQVINKIVTGTGTILLIDDEIEVALTCSKLLQRIGYQVETYHDPAEAMEAFFARPDHFSLVLTDLVMPGISGNEVCQMVRECRPNCPLVAYSAYQPDGLEFEDMGLFRFIEKPVDPAQLAHVVGELTQMKVSI